MAGKTPKQHETSSERALGRIGSERYARFLTKIAPLEKEYLSDIADQRDTQNLERGLVSNDYAAATSGVRQQAATGLQKGGTALGLADVSTNLGAAEGAGKAGLESGLEQQYVGQLQNAVATGSGQAGQAIGGLSSAAEAAGQRARQEARLALQNRQAGQQAVLGGLGLGTALAASPGGSDFLKNAAGGVLGAGVGLSGAMSPTGTVERYNQPGAKSGLTTYPYPGA